MVPATSPSAPAAEGSTRASGQPAPPHESARAYCRCLNYRGFNLRIPLASVPALGFDFDLDFDFLVLILFLVFWLV
jgi:hypothetical protein